MPLCYTLAMTVIFRKRANAKLRGVKGSDLGGDYETRGLPEAVAGVSEKLTGGTWVGGTVTLTDEALIFNANNLNRSFASGNLDRYVPLAEITGAAIVGRFPVKTIGVNLIDGSRFDIRCGGAAKALQSLLDAIPDATPDG